MSADERFKKHLAIQSAVPSPGVHRVHPGPDPPHFVSFVNSVRGPPSPQELPQRLTHRRNTDHRQLRSKKPAVIPHAGQQPLRPDPSAEPLTVKRAEAALSTPHLGQPSPAGHLIPR